ncbi:phospholipid-transporting ATPase VD-like isoform X2 [Rhinoraja longicauda]
MKMANPIQWARYRWQRLLSTDSNNSYNSSFPRWFKNSRSQKIGDKNRTVIPCLGRFTEEYEKVIKNYKTNRIQTTKYTLLNFIPMNLFEQFGRQAKKYRSKWWKDVRVGDFVRLVCNEIIPADMVLLYSTDVNGICHIETSNLDGETNLKQRQVVKGFTELDSEVDPEKFTCRIECEGPNNDLSKFIGYMEHWNKERVGLSKENLLLRGCMIRNTEAVAGIVVYAGHETKAMMNNRGPRYKHSKLERQLNRDVLCCVALLLVMCLIGAFGHGIWLSGFSKPPIFGIQGPTGSRHPVLAGFLIFWTMIILLQVLIPISLYVSIEIVKLGQILLLQSDIDLYNESTDSTIQCRALNITEDLGQIEYIFSDKTGTLTENKMIFCRCNIAGVEYSHEENAKRLELYQDDNPEVVISPSLGTASKCQHSDSSRSPSTPQSRNSLNCLPSNSSIPREKDAFEDEKEITATASQVAFSSSIERDVTPDSLLFQKLGQIVSHPLLLLEDTGKEVLPEFSYIVDFFFALTICNTVVVSCLAQSGQRVGIPSISNTPIKSLEEIKQMFQRFSVPRMSSPSLSMLKDSFIDNPSAFAGRLLNRVKPASPSALKEQNAAAAGSAKNRKSIGQISAGEGSNNIPEEDDKTAGSVLSPGTSTEQSNNLKLRYEAESPDEAALVHAARAYNCTLISRTSDQVTVELANLGRLQFQLLHTLPFDAVRKRMSVVVRHPLTNKVVVYTKGADSGMMDLLNISGDRRQKRIREKTQNYLDGYAKEGLRTLCIAKKVMSDVEYAEWLEFHLVAESSIDNQEELLLESALKLETNLTLLGSTGIVDRLQEGVPDTILALRKACIKTWLLTGDKLETAVNIAYACKLLEETDTIFTLNTQNKEACEDLINKLIAEITEQTTDKKNTPGVGSSPSSSCDGEVHIALVIDGKTLEFALHESLQDTFLELSKRCRAVICCRSTPLQKSKVVHLVREKLKVMTLAIGDGANDVSMIQVADVGIGISGQEGMQAVMSSDFAISRFKHLKKLLLVHGHWCYIRLANMILYFFYKNVTYVNLLFCYQFFCGFSGASMIDYWILIFFNLLFTSVPPLVCGILDKDVSAETLLQLPELYISGQRSEAYLPSIFWISILDAFYQSLVCFFIPYFVYSDTDVDIYTFGTPINTTILFIIFLHLLIEGKTWTWINWSVMIGSVVLYFAFALIYGETCINCNPPSTPYFTMEYELTQPLFYLVCLLATFVALLPRYIFRIFQATVFPSPLLKARQLDRLRNKEQVEPFPDCRLSRATVEHPL